MTLKDDLVWRSMSATKQSSQKQLVLTGCGIGNVLFYTYKSRRNFQKLFVN